MDIATERLIGVNLRLVRERHNMSQTQFANLLGVTFQQLQKYEKGRNRIAASRLHALSRQLGISCDDFFVGL